MSWRTADGRYRPGADTVPDELAALMVDLGRGSSSARRRLLALGAEANDHDLGHLLDRLAAAAADGHQDALEILLATIGQRDLTGPALSRLVSDRALADDIGQEVLVAVARSVHRFRGESRFTTWLYTLTRNVAIAQLRRQNPSSPLAGDDGLADVGRRMSSLVSERRDVHEAIESLPSPFRDAVVLRDIRGLSYAEIADHQGVAINTVRSRLSRGRAMLVGRVT